MTTLLNLGDIGRAIGLGVVLPKKFVTDTLGVQPEKMDKAAALFTDQQAAMIYTKLAERVTALAGDAKDGMLDVPEKPAPKAKEAPPADDDEL
jgi:hypothetical protein